MPMRRASLLRGLSALCFALYVGVGFGVPIADAVVFHQGRTAAILPAAGGERPSPGIHEVCLLALHTLPALPAAVAAPEAGGPLPAAGLPRIALAAPRDAAPAGLPASRAPPLA
jgi:hypothetical protein